MSMTSQRTQRYFTVVYVANSYAGWCNFYRHLGA